MNTTETQNDHERPVRLTGLLGTDEGWTWVHGSRKWHYYRGRKALCGKMLLFIHPADGYQIGNDDSPDNCATCRRKLAGA